MKDYVLFRIALKERRVKKKKTMENEK